MADSINLNDLFSRFEATGIFERFQQGFNRSGVAESNRNDGTDEAVRLGQLRASLARRRRNVEAVQVEFSARAQERRAAQETGEANRPERAEAPEQAARPREEERPATRASLRQRFQQAIEAFQTANEPAPARRGDAQGTPPAAAGAARGNQERRGFQIGAPPAALGRREEPRLDGLRMAASFQQTALGNALNRNQPPNTRINNPINQGPLTQRQSVNATGGAAQNADGTLFGGGGGANRIGRGNLDAPGAVGRGFGGADQQAQGPLARVQERFNNPGGLGTENNLNPLAARAGNERGGLVREPLVERMVPGQQDAGDANAPGVDAGAANRDIGAGQAPDYLNANNLFAGGNDTPLARGNAAPGQGEGANAGAGVGANPVAQDQATPDLLQINRGDIAGLGADAGPIAGPAEAEGPGVAPPPKPLVPDQPGQLQETPTAPLEAQAPPERGAGPTRDDVQGGVAPERGAPNPAPPEPEPVQTPGEAAAGLETTPRATADAELRANVPRPILEPADQDGAGRTPPGVTADNELRGGEAAQAGAPPPPAVAEPPANAGTPPNPREENLRAPETARPAGEEGAVGGGPGVAPARGGGAGPAGAAGAAEQGGAAPIEEGPANRAERSALEEALESRATRAYEQQQEESATTEPNRGRTVTELFVR